MKFMIRTAGAARLMGLAIIAAIALTGFTARALTKDEAQAHVSAVIDEVLALVTEDSTPTAKENRFRAVMDANAAMPQIARFAMGAPWRTMTDAQKAEYIDAFDKFIAHIYAKRFVEYNGEKIDIVKTVDAGKKGKLVVSQVEQPDDGKPITVEWLVSDRGGKPQIVDLTVEGVSLAITQRSEFSAMIDTHHGDIDEFISDLKARAGK